MIPLSLYITETLMVQLSTLGAQHGIFSQHSARHLYRAEALFVIERLADSCKKTPSLYFTLNHFINKLLNVSIIAQQHLHS